MSKIKKEFSKNAMHYNQYNQIQKKVVSHLLEQITTKPKNILDLGAGEGELYSQIDWNISNFIAVDFSQEMCKLHPKNKKIKVINADFNKLSTFDNLTKYKFDYIISASALQWADNLDLVFKQISSFKKPIALALFTSNTFQTLHDKIGIKSPLFKKDEIVISINKYMKPKFEVKNFALEFESTKSMLDYIKKSGVSSGEKRVSIKQIRGLIRENILNKIETEVIFITFPPKCSKNRDKKNL